jgi:antitoxin (DNA-binding transcriptional repressor) of toxin-antitoxin stability system
VLLGVVVAIEWGLFALLSRLRGSANGTGQVYRSGRPVADIVPVKAAMPAWKKPPQARLSLGTLNLGDEVLADRTKCAEDLFRHLRAERSPGTCSDLRIIGRHLRRLNQNRRTLRTQ